MTAPGWYQDPVPSEGGLRYFDGTDWTDQRVVKLLSSEERKERLDVAVAQAIRQKIVQQGRVESRTDYGAVIVYGHACNHVLWLLLSALTCGLFAIGWIIAWSTQFEHRLMLEVDVYGRISTTEITRT
jgi:hypothetical protein